MLRSLSNFFLCRNSKCYAVTSRSGQRCLESGLFLASLSFTGVCFSNMCFFWCLKTPRALVGSSLPLLVLKWGILPQTQGVFFLFRAISRDTKFAGVVLWTKNTGIRDFGRAYWEDYHSGWDVTAVCQSCSLAHEWLGWQVRAWGIQLADDTKLKWVSGTLEDKTQIQSNFWAVTTSRKPSRVWIC